MNVPLIVREKDHLPRPIKLTSSSGRIKILTLGDAYVGKSTLIKAYCEGKFISDYLPTIGIDYGVKTTNIEGLEVKLNFWDVAGDPMYYEVRNEFYRDTHGAILVFDLSFRKSFENLNQWITEINKYMNNKKIVIHLIGNKLDKEPRVVSYEEAAKFAMINNFKYTEIAANDIDSVNKLFEKLFLDVIGSYKTQDKLHNKSVSSSQQLNENTNVNDADDKKYQTNQSKSQSRPQSKRQHEVSSNNSNNSQYLSNTNEMTTEQREVQKTENDNSSNVIS